MEKENKKELVSIVVGTFNSSKYVVETLDSIKSQTYNEIELIITDDCSSDDTVAVCQKWLAQNSSRFVNAYLVTSDKNTGSSINANRGLTKATGEWVKMFAGDDLLMNDAIENYMSFVNDTIDVCFAEYYEFSGKLEDGNIEKKSIAIDNVSFGDKITAKRQYNILKKQLIGSGTTCFARLSVMKEAGFYDERFPLMDDYPLYLNMSARGHKFYLMHKPTCYYRVHSSSISHSANKNALISNAEIRCFREYKYQYKYEHLSGLWRLFLKYSMWLSNLVVDLGNNRRNFCCLLVFYFRQLTDPFQWYSRFLNVWDKMLKRL